MSDHEWEVYDNFKSWQHFVRRRMMMIVMGMEHVSESKLHTRKNNINRNAKKYTKVNDNTRKRPKNPDESTRVDSPNPLIIPRKGNPLLSPPLPWTLHPQTALHRWGARGGLRPSAPWYPIEPTNSIPLSIYIILWYQESDSMKSKRKSQ